MELYNYYGKIRVTAPFSIDAGLDLGGDSHIMKTSGWLDVSAGDFVRMGRFAANTGEWRVDIMRGDDSTHVNHRLGGGTRDSFVANGSSGQRFGVGTTTPQNKFHVVGNSQFDGRIDINEGGANGRVLMSLNIERAWTIRQRGTGASAVLSFRAEVASKALSIEDNNGGEVFRVHTADGTRVFGNFAVSGSKSAVVDTENYGKRLMYAYEGTMNWFFDLLNLKLEPGKWFIQLNQMFLETITNEYFVKVFTQNCCGVQLLKREQKGFWVNIDTQESYAEVFFEVYGLRRGYEYEYMKELKEDIYASQN